jgi:hypothetical protein
MTRAIFARAAVLAALVSVLAVPAFAGADTVTSSIEAPRYATGTIDNVHDWTSTAAAGGYLDHLVTDLSSIGPSYPYAYTNAFGSRALRISNGQSSGGFGNQTFSPSTPNEAGETTSESLGMTGGERQNMFQASFTIASALPGVSQPGLYVGVSPDRGDGARMGLMRFLDSGNGSGDISVNWSDYHAGDPAFTTHPVATLDGSEPHRVTIKINFFDGPSNDVVTLKIDGTDVTPSGGITSWEDYSRQFGEPPTVDSLLFRTSLDGGSPANNTALMGKGFLFDNIAVSTPAVAANGPTGATGAAGSTGQTGATGATGASGSAGANGATGAAGATGASGAAGSNGNDGNNGVNGRDGAGDTPDPVDAGTYANARIGNGSVIRKGRFYRVPVLCASSGQGLCAGSVEIRFGKRLIASTGFAVFQGTRYVRLTSVGKILVGARLRFTVIGWSPSGSSTRSGRTIRIR